MFGRFRRYGPTFTLSLMGVRLYVLTQPGDLRGPYRDEGAEPAVPFSSFQRLMEVAPGRPYDVQADKAAHGPWRRMFLSALGPAGLQALLPRAQAVIQAHLSQWEAAAGGSCIASLFREVRLLAVDLAIDVIAEVPLPPGVQRSAFRDKLLCFLDGLFGLPIALPGSSVARALAAKEELVAALGPLLAADRLRMAEQWRAAGSRYSALVDALTTGSAAAATDAAATAAAASGKEGSGAAQPASSPPGAAARVTVRDAVISGFMALGFDSERAAAVSVLHAVVAGADTTRFALFNTLALVAMSPRVQEEIFAEQQRVIAAHGPELSVRVLLLGSVGAGAAAATPYLDAVVREAMRLLPATPGNMRRLTADLRVATAAAGNKGGAASELVIPKGAMVWRFVPLQHCLDPVCWDGNTAVDVPPHMDWRNNFEGAFRPERWLSEETRPKYYYTFGSDSHLCVGQNLAYMEVKLLLALLLRKYRLRLEARDMLARATQMFPFIIPRRGTDRVLLESCVA
ncbi:hypothetical protein HYH02_010371 [Chlamydomonas schloesseri]|uniref:Cytochrome P450 n=1 Tax=Chlamydomonas schloesseri TaxID=2026947 RepID=A0A835TC41_9CHLO|nr:hypothetical protein HYH02_010371 [Chlamydomonas schloesseri]|eukprot:KAG2440493.1 hypothetical protein HYH02_010371 [Chlamydomonas schloesseri]